MSTLSKALRWGLHLLGENAEARIRELTRKVEGLQAAYDLLSATAKAERDEYDRFIARLTPRTYREGDPPPEAVVLWWDHEDKDPEPGWWRWRGQDLRPGDHWLPMLPSPSDWPQFSGISKERCQFWQPVTDNNPPEGATVISYWRIAGQVGFLRRMDGVLRTADDIDEEDEKWVRTTTPSAWAPLPLDPGQQHAHDALEKVTQERDEARRALAGMEDLVLGMRQERDAYLRRSTESSSRSEAFAAEDWGSADIDALRAERDAAQAELARLRPHYDAIMVLAGACDGDPSDPASIATTFLDMGKAMLQAQKERDECAARVHEHARRLDRVREILRKWEWTEDQITSFVALPGEPRTHVFPALWAGGLDEVCALPPLAEKARLLKERNAAEAALDGAWAERDAAKDQVEHFRALALLADEAKEEVIRECDAALARLREALLASVEREGRLVRAARAALGERSELEKNAILLRAVTPPPDEPWQESGPQPSGAAQRR